MGLNIALREADKSQVDQPRGQKPLILTTWNGQQHRMVLGCLFLIGFVLYGLTYMFAGFEAELKPTALQTTQRAIWGGLLGGLAVAFGAYAFIFWLWICERIIFKLFSLGLMPKGFGPPRETNND